MNNSQVSKMQVFVYIIAGLYSLRYVAVGFNQNISDGDLSSFVNSNHSEEMYLETTENSINPDSSKSYLEYFRKPELLTSDPLFEDASGNASSLKDPNRKRDISEHGLSYETKMQILQLHNFYRSNVTPPAGDMSYLEWDEELARLAQIWADGCLFDHGMPENDYPDNIGQNLYIGADRTGYLGLYMWYEEYHNYDLRKDYCIPGKQCGHYQQMVWSGSKKLGCGMTKCSMRYYHVCHYSPQAVLGTQIYRVASPCSQCRPKEKCLKNLCITPQQCKNNPFDCHFAKCELECLNCGHLDKENCLCECADGWDSPDCSRLCADKHKMCGKSPGFPNKVSCSLNQYEVGKTYCRKMCGKCDAVNTTISNNTCCGGKLCDEGFVLDPFCKCVLLCPGPECDGEDAGESQALSENNANSANYLSQIPHFTQWIIIFMLHFRICIQWGDF